MKKANEYVELHEEIKALKAAIAEIKKECEKQLGELPATLRAVEDRANEIRDLLIAHYDQAMQDRRAKLLAGDPEPKIKLHERISFARLQDVQVIDSCKVPIEWCEPSLVQIRKAVLSGIHIEGVEKIEKWSLRVK